MLWSCHHTQFEMWLLIHAVCYVVEARPTFIMRQPQTASNYITRLTRPSGFFSYYVEKHCRYNTADIMYRCLRFWQLHSIYYVVTSMMKRFSSLTTRIYGTLISVRDQAHNILLGCQNETMDVVWQKNVILRILSFSYQPNLQLF